MLIFSRPKAGFQSVPAHMKFALSLSDNNNHENHSGRTKKAGDLGTVGLFWPRKMFFGFMFESSKPRTPCEFDGVIVYSGCYCAGAA